MHTVLAHETFKALHNTAYSTYKTNILGLSSGPSNTISIICNYVFNTFSAKSTRLFRLDSRLSCAGVTGEDEHFSLKHTNVRM